MSVISHPYHVALSSRRPSLLHSFFQWCNLQQPNRFLWLGIALMGQAAILAPLTLAVVLLTGFHFGLLMVVLGAIGITVIANLAALPTKVTIPVLAFSILVDLIVMIASIAMVVTAS